MTHSEGSMQQLTAEYQIRLDAVKAKGVEYHIIYANKSGRQEGPAWTSIRFKVKNDEEKKQEED